MKELRHFLAFDKAGAVDYDVIKILPPRDDLEEQRQGCPGRCTQDSLGRRALKQDRRDVLHVLAKA